MGGGVILIELQIQGSNQEGKAAKVSSSVLLREMSA